MPERLLGSPYGSHISEDERMRILVATAVSVALVFGSLSMVSAAEEKKPTAQQEKMKACNTQAGDKKGDERKAFMSECLKAGAPAAPMLSRTR